MQIDSEILLNEVRELYVNNPCGISCIAFWKLEGFFQESETYRLEENGHTYLFALRDQRLEFYWSDDKERFILTRDQLEVLDLLVLPWW